MPFKICLKNMQLLTSRRPYKGTLPLLGGITAPQNIQNAKLFESKFSGIHRVAYCKLQQKYKNIAGNSAFVIDFTWGFDILYKIPDQNTKRRKLFIGGSA